MKLKTVGLSAKTLVAAALPLVGGIVLLLVDKLTSDSIDDTIWWTLIGSSPLIGGGAYAAPAAPTRVRNTSRRGEAGYGIIEVLFALILLLILIYVLFAVVR